MIRQSVQVVIDAVTSLTKSLLSNLSLSQSSSRTLTSSESVSQNLSITEFISAGGFLPEPDYETDNPGIQSGMDIFSPPIKLNATLSGPILTEITETITPNHVINVAGQGSFTPLFYSQSTNSDQILSTNSSILRNLFNLVTYTVPGNLPSSAAILFWPSQTSRPKMINKAKPTWLLSKTSGYNNAAPGDTIVVHGRNLSKPVVSSSTNTIQTGNLTFTVDTGLNFQTDQTIMILARGANFMDGTVVSYSGSTLTVNITKIQGSGTFSSWEIYGLTWVLLKCNGQQAFVQATYADPWTVEFVLPTVIGTHTITATDQINVAIHNNMGGKYGYTTCPMPIIIYTPTTFADYPSIVIPSGDTSGVTDYNTLQAIINSSFSSLRITLSAGTFYLNQPLMLAGHFGVPMEIVGQGKSVTIVKASATVTLFSTNSAASQLRNLTVDTNSNSGATNGVIQYIRCINCSIKTKGALSAAVAWGGGGNQVNGYLINCDITGRVCFTNLSPSLYVDNCQFYITDGDYDGSSAMALYVWSSSNIHITNCIVQNFNPDGAWSERGDGKFVDFGSGNTSNVYIARNQTIRLSAHTNDSNPNSGEQICAETYSTQQYSGTVLTTTGNTATFASYTGVTNGFLFVVGGTGYGQRARFTASGNTLTFDRTLLLDSTSQVATDWAIDNWVVVLNILNGDNQTGTASTAFEPFGNSSDYVVDHNSISNMVYGFDVFGESAWSSIANNDVKSCETFIRFFSSDLGSSVRDNTGSQISKFLLWDSPAYLDNCVIQDAPTAINIDTVPPSRYILWDTQLIGNGTGHNTYNFDLEGTSSITGFV